MLVGGLLLQAAPAASAGTSAPAPAPPAAPGVPSPGGAYVWADFDGDGYTDLAVGVPREDLAGIDNAGAVAVVYGTPRGLGARGNQFWHQGRLQDMLDPGDRFGHAVAAGDFNDDGYADLAIGTPFEDQDGNNDSGGVNVVYGSRGGLRARGNQFWHQGRLRGALEADDGFGSSLAAGDFDGDGYTDLAVGAPTEDLDGSDGAGAVNIIHGSAGGLRARGNQFWHQGRLQDVLEPGDRFGHAVATGDFNGDGYADLAIGAPLEDLDATISPGAVSVVQGTRRGLRARGSQFWHQGRLGDAPEAFDEFGRSLATGDFDGDGYADLAIGAPGEELSGSIEAGAVSVVHGTRRGLRARGSQFWHQGRLRDGPEAFDLFGRSLATGDFDGDGNSDLAIGASEEDLGGNNNAGAVNVIYGTGGGLRARGNQLWHQGRLKGELEAGDSFGEALVAGDFDGDGHFDLAIGAPFEDLGGNNDAGVVNVVYGAGRGLAGRGSQLWHEGRLRGESEGGDNFGLALA